jgi:phage head maturation protease
MGCGTVNCIELPKQTRGAEIRASSFSEADNTVEVIWATGSVVRRRNIRGEVCDEELIVTPDAVNMERLNGGAAPFLNSHAAYDLSTVIGTVVAGSARIANGQETARVKLSSAPGDADVVQKIKEGVIRSVSTGYSIDRVEVVERSGDVPLWRVTRWTPLELSGVAIGADAGAHIRSTATTFPCLVGTSAATSNRPWERTFAEPFERVVIPR